MRREYVVMSTNIPETLAREIKEDAVKHGETVTETIRQILLSWSVERRRVALKRPTKSILDDI
jgi:hypothetical protein